MESCSCTLIVKYCEGDLMFLYFYGISFLWISELLQPIRMSCCITVNIALRIFYCWYQFFDICRYNNARVLHCYWSCLIAINLYSKKKKSKRINPRHAYFGKICQVLKEEKVSSNVTATASNRIIPCQNLWSNFQ